MRTPTLLAIASLALITTSPSAQAPARPFVIEPVALSVPLDSGEPRLTTTGDRVFLSWIEHGSRATLRFAERTASGWTPPLPIASGTNLMVNAADVPSVHLLPNGTFVAQWLQQHGADPEAYDLRLARSADAGKTWTPAVSPHHDRTATQHGFASLFPAADGGFGLIWLDGRSGDEMALRATSFAPDGKQRDETEIDGRVCECCQTSAALTADGPIVAFRDRAADEVRDIHVSRLTAGRWSAPVAVHRDGWKIDGCPVNGPAVSASGRDVVVAWFAVQNTQGHAFIAFSQDAGRTFGAPIRVDDATAIGRVQVALVTGGAAVTSWIDFTDGRSQFRVRRIERNGMRGPAVTIAEGIGTQYPRMAARSTELVFAWAENTRGSIRVRTAHAVLPSTATAGR